MTSTYEQQKQLEDNFGLAELAPATSSLSTIASLKAAAEMFDGTSPADRNARAALKAVAKEELRATAIGAQLITGNNPGSIALQNLCGSGAEGAAKAGRLARQHAAQLSFQDIMNRAGSQDIGGGTTIIQSLQRNGIGRFTGRASLINRGGRRPPPGGGGGGGGGGGAGVPFAGFGGPFGFGRR